MAQLSNILAATDFSGRADRAVDRAMHLARQHGATLHLVHVMDRLLLQMFAGTVDEHPLATEQRLVDATRTRLKEHAGQLASRFNVPVKDHLLIGRVQNQLTQCAAAHGVELCVLGAHGENFVREVFVGSTASKYLRKGRQPTLVVRSERAAPYEQVLVAVDFSPASRLAFEYAARIAPQAEIHVLHVSELPFEGKMRYAGIEEGDIAMYRRNAERDAQRALDAFLDGIDGAAQLSRSVVAGRPAHAIIAQAQARKADLVVMGKRGKFEVDDFLLGSVTLRVLEEIDRDLLLVAPAHA